MTSITLTSVCLLVPNYLVSCALFNRFSTFLHWLVSKKSQNSHIIHYLDDFLFGGVSGDTTCHYTLTTFHLAAEL